MTIRTAIIASTAILALAACGKNAETTQTNTVTNAQVGDTGVATTSTTTAPENASQNFANAAAASDAFEIATSQAALAKSSSASVKSYAQKMIDAHTASTAKLKAASSQATPTLTPDPTLNPEQQRKLDKLKGLEGSAFDQGYIAEQAAAHQQTLDTLKAYAATSDTPSLETFATGLIPIVTAHLNMAKGLKA